MRIARCLILTEPPSIDANEITDKGYLNQRAVLTKRAALVERLHGQPAAADVIVDFLKRPEQSMDDLSHAQTIIYEDIWLMGGARTPFADYNGTLRDVSATDLGIKAAREALQATQTDAGKDRRGGGCLAWRRPASMRSFWRATSGCTRAFRSACRRWWCSGCARRGSRRSCRRPTRSRSASRTRCCASAPNPCRAIRSPPTPIAAASGWGRSSSRISCGRRRWTPRPSRAWATRRRNWPSATRSRARIRTRLPPPASIAR